MALAKGAPWPASGFIQTCPGALRLRSPPLNFKRGPGVLCTQLPAERQHGRSGLEGHPRRSGRPFTGPGRRDREETAGAHVVAPLWFSQGSRLPLVSSSDPKDRPEGAAGQAAAGRGKHTPWAAGLMLGAGEQSRAGSGRRWGQRAGSFVCGERTWVSVGGESYSCDVASRDTNAWVMRSEKYGMALKKSQNVNYYHL